jgi:amino acid adenylation domain-containing protein/non-ribosomal peptide synthase protein (TIGR01720 family)
MDLISSDGTAPFAYLREYPLSNGQRALWFLYKMAPDAVAYNLAGAAAIPGDTDPDALQRAFRRLAQRHPMLRTTFAAPGGEPVQRVHAEADVAFDCEDASAWNARQLDEHLASAIYRPFDLEQGPAWRVHVFRGAPVPEENPQISGVPDHLVLLTLHHIVGDLWSVAVLMSETAALYHEETTGVPARLKPLRANYADHVYHEREMLAGPRGEASWGYWREILQGDLPPLNLPTDRPRPPVQTDHGATHAVLLGQELTDRLKAVAEEHRVALYTVLLAALQTLLHRYTGQNDILTGFPKAGRSAATARAIGYFVNPVVIRARFAEDPHFSDVLLRTQRAIEESAEHDWYPFPLLVSRLRPSRDLSYSPVFQVMFSWQKTTRLVPKEHAGALALGQTGHRADLGGLPMRPVPMPHRTASFDLTVSAAEVAGGLAVTVEYNTDLFDAPTIGRLAQCYRTLLDSITAAPDRPVSLLTILTEDARRQLLVDSNATAAPYPEFCLHQLFEAQVEQWPDVIALECEGQELTNRQLNCHANQLAHHLMQQGVGPGSSVGLCCEPSLQTIIGVLGILKAGAAYVPIDPHYPQDRQTFILNDTRASVLVTHSAVHDRLPSFAGSILDLDGDWPLISQQPDTNPPALVTADNLAYVIFTSGSTGQAKGAALAHRGVVNLLTDCQQRQAIVPGDACSWWTSISFDVSVYEIFSALLAGGTLHVIPQALRLDAPALLDWLHTHHIRHAYLPPFLLADFAAWLQLSSAPSELRRLLVGVEPIPEQLLISISAQLPELRILNGYGPTETTICSTLYTVDPTRPPHGKTPIGRPVLNTQIYLLDRHLQPVPVGVTGEMYIGGAGLARGYLNRPDLTAERFLPNPFGSQPGTHLYRSGDLARYLPDGNLEFLGRSDDQLKIHGVRIEPAEIEAALTLHPAVRSAAVEARPDQRGDSRLVAYLVPTGPPPPSPPELRRFLAQSLPEYMLPSTFVVLDALPLTPSGKLDRRGLPAPDDVRPQRSRAFRALRTKTEEILVTIWQKALGTEVISVDDNFFELGGDSIVAMQIVSQAARAGLRLTPKHLFQAPTVAGLAALADASASIQVQSEQGALAGELPLTPIQRWFFEHNFPQPHHWNQSLMFSTPQPLEPVHLRAAVAALIAHHDALRLRFVKGPLGWQQSYAGPGEEIPFEVIDLASMPESLQTTAIQEYAAAQQASLDLSSGPLIRVAYFDLGAELPGRLLIVIHHLAVDAVSWRILLEDLQTAYRQLRRGEGIRLPPKTTSFREWAQRLVDFTDSAQFRQEASFWLSSATGDRPALPVDLAPAGQAGDVNTEATARRISAGLSREETQNLLRQGVTARGTRISEVLLTALARAFQRWSGSRTLWVDVEGHGREDLFEDVDLSRTVGWFTALYPVCLDLPSTGKPEDVLKAIEDQLRHIPRHGLGYGLLRHLRTDRALTETIKAIRPAEVSFNYLGQINQPAGDDLVFQLAPESVGPMRGPDAPRAYLHEISAAIIEGELRIDWIYSFRLHRRETIELVASYFTQELRHLMAGLTSLHASKRAPSDVPMPALDPTELDAPHRITRAEALAELPVVAHRDIESAYPLSPMQQGMLFHTLNAPDSGVYIQQISCAIEGPLDLAAFSGAWQRVLDRHTILRSSVTGEHLDRMLQVVHKNIKLPFDMEDWRPLAAAEQQARFDALLTTERRRGFDPGKAPLWHLTLVRTADHVHRCLLTHHHALLDGWSLALLFQEVFALYGSMVLKQDLTLPPARPYSDYIAWLQTRDLAAAEAFWREALAACAPLPSLPIQRAPSPAVNTAQPADQETRLSIDETSALKTLARQQHLTLNTLVQGAWALLLGRYSQQAEIIFGATVAGRSADLAGSETMIGIFINTLPMRVHIDLHARLIEWLHQLQRQAAEARQYDYCPLVQIQAWSGVRHGLSLFDTILVFENYPIDAVLHKGHSGLRISNVRAIEQTNYPLAVAIIPGQRLRLKISYDRARFESAAVDSLLRDLRQLLDHMTANPDQRLSEVAQLPEHKVDRCIPPACPPTVPRPAHVAPQGTLQLHLARLWAEALQIDRVGVRDDFFEVGGNSLMGAVLVSKLRRELGEDLPLAAIFDAPTVAELARYLEQNHPRGVAQLLGAPPAAPSKIEASPATPALPQALVPIQPNGTRPPLFCIHPAGGIVFPYYTLARHLGEDQPLYGLQDPSLHNAGSSFRSIEEMAAHYLGVLRTIQPAGPYHLMGWSVGGVIAYEIAQQLSRQGEMVSHLIMLDTSAPGRAVTGRRRLSPGGFGSLFASRLKPLLDRIQESGSAVLPIASYVRSGLFLLAASAKRKQATSHGSLTVVDLLGWAILDTWRKRLLGEAEVAGMVPQDSSLLLVEMPDVRRILRMVPRHIRLARRYSAQMYQGHVALFRALRLEPNEQRAGDLSLGWARLAAGGVEIRIIRANHVALLVNPYAKTLAQELAACLDRDHSSPDGSNGVARQ